MPQPAQLTARPSSGDQRVEMILSCAERLFQARGYNGVSMRDLAAAVDVKMSSLYYYFESKEEILYRIIKRHLMHIESATATALERVPRAAHVERLRVLVATSVACMIEDRAASSLASSEVRHLTGEQWRELQEMLQAFEDRFVATIQAGMASSTGSASS